MSQSASTHSGGEPPAANTSRGVVADGGGDYYSPAQPEPAEQHEHELHVACFPGLIARRPLTVMAALLLLALGALVVALTVSPFELSAQGTFYARSDEVATAVDAFRVRFENDATLAEVPRQSDTGEVSVLIEFEAGEDSDDLLDAASLKHIRSLEDRIMAIDGYADFCFKPLSVNSTTSASSSSSSPWPPAVDAATGCSRPFSAISAIDAALASGNATDLASALALVAAASLDPPADASYLGTTFATTFAPGNLRSRVLRLVVPIGLPLAGYANARDRYADQIDEYALWVPDLLDMLRDTKDDWGESDGPGIEMYWAGVIVTDRELERLIFADLILVSGAILIVFVLMLIQTWSVFLAATGIANILLCFPLAYAVFKYIFQFEIFSAINALGVFVVLGIGADDCFVLVDAFKQSRHERHLLHDLEVRFTWAWKRAAKAMLVTSLTTFVAFMASATSSIPAIRTFGIFAAISVVVNYALSISLYACMVILYHKYFEFRYCCCCLASRCAEVAPNPRAPYGKGGIDHHQHHHQGGQGRSARPIEMTPQTQSPSPSQTTAPVPSSSTSAAAAAAAAQQQKQQQQQQQQSRGEVAVDVVQGDKTDSNKSAAASELEPERDDIDSFRPLERFFYKVMSPNLMRFRLAIIGVCTVILVLAVVGSAYLSTPETQPSGLPDDHPVVQMLRIDPEFRTTIGFGEAEEDLYVFWGLTGIDRSGIDPNNNLEPGLPEFDATFDVSSEAAQAAVLGACDRIASEENFIVQGAHLCPMREFREWLGEDPARPAFPVPAGNFSLLFSEFSRSPRGVESGALYSWRERDHTTGLKWIAASFVTAVSFTSPASEQRAVYTHYKQMMEDIGDASAATGIGRPMFAKQLFVWMRTSEILGGMARTGIIISLALAFVVLLVTTHNVISSVIALVTLGTIMAATVGTMVVAGVELAFSEAVAFSILGGLAVDFTVHYSVAFTEAHDEGSRYARTRRAITELGVSVCGGAATTLFATAPLFMAKFPFFAIFGSVIFTLIAFSFLFSNTYLPAMLMVAGPVGKTGDWLFWIREKIRRHRQVRDTAGQA